MKLTNYVELLSENERALKRIVSYLNLKNIGTDNAMVLEIIPEGYEVLKYKIWGLKHASRVFSNGKSTFDEIDVKAITGLDRLEDALEVIGVSESDIISEAWLIDCLFELNESLAAYNLELSNFLKETFSLSDNEIQNIKNIDPEVSNSAEMEKVRSIFGR